MLVSDKLAYIQFTKTGCTRIAEILQEVIGGEYIGRKHAPASEAPPGKLLVGSIRHPLSWYVSLWAFGCAGKGGWYSKLRKEGKEDLYADVGDERLFRKWLDVSLGVMGERYKLTYDRPIDFWLRLEFLSHDLALLLDTIGHSVDKDALERLCQKRVNTSEHLPYQTYYSRELREKVCYRELAIADDHYSPFSSLIYPYG